MGIKILQVIQKPQFRGVEIFTCQLSNELIKCSYEVEIITLYGGNIELPFNGKTMVLNRPKYLRFFDLLGWRYLATYIDYYKPDIVQANASDTLKFTVFSKRIFRWKQPIIFRNANKLSDFIDSNIKYQFNRWLLHNVSHVISVSDECQKDLVQTFSFLANKCSTISIGIDPIIIKPLADDVKFIFDKGPVLLHVGSFVKEKNHEGLIEIFMDLHRQYDDIQLILIGTGKQFETVRNRISDCGLAQCIHLLGTRNDVLSIMNASSVFLMPSQIEGLPGVILEAMYSKLPVVAYNVGGISEVISDNVTGRLIEKDDSLSFVNAVKGLLENNTLRNHIVSNAKRMVDSRFLNADIAKKFDEAYFNVFTSQ